MTSLATVLVSLAAVLVATGAAANPPADHANCPMAAAHARKDQVDRRHGATTGVGPEGVHRFLVEPRGGTIRLEAVDGAPPAVRERIRAHLRAAARAFAAGDFTMSQAIHGALPPSVTVLQSRRAALRYVFGETDRGGAIRITTDDPVALEALHDFLRFQIEDHHTGDPAR